MSHEDKVLNDIIGQRRAAYPSIEDQLDMLWHAINNNQLDKTCDFFTVIHEIKTRLPKPEL